LLPNPANEALPEQHLATAHKQKQYKNLLGSEKIISNTKYFNSYDAIYNLSSKVSTENKNVIGKSILTVADLESVHPVRSTLSKISNKSSSLRQLPVQSETSNFNNQNYKLKNNNIILSGVQTMQISEPKYRNYFGTQPILKSKNYKIFNSDQQALNIIPKSQSKILQYVESIMPMNNINWRHIGIIALLKFTLVKLKALGFMNFLFLLLFKLKLLLIVLHFKFFILLKLIKFFKFLLLPLFFLPLLFIIPLLISPAIVMNTPNNLNDNISNFPNSLEDSHEETVLVPGETVLVPGETVLVPGETVVVPGETVVVPGETVLVPDETTSQVIDPNIPPTIQNAFNVLGELRYNTLKSLDRDLAFFQKILKTENFIPK